MKTRLSALAVVISSSMLTACGSGGPGSFTTDVPPPAPTPAPTPTVTVTAPATATAGFAFTAGWTSTDATSCAADFDSADTGTTGSTSVTETAAGTKTYSVTCTGAGGDATGTATVVISGAPTAEGAWHGTTGSGRNVSGVVTKEGDYWLAYAPTSTILGFYAGTGASTAVTETTGTYVSSNLREFNFAGGFSGGGNAAAGTLDSGAFTLKTSFSGVLTPVTGGAVIGAIFDNITSTGTVKLSGIVESNEVGVSVGSTTLNGNTLTIRMSDQVTLAPANGTDSATIVSDEVFTGTFSGGVFTPTAGGQGNVISCTPTVTAGASNQICSGTHAGDVQPFTGQGGSVNVTTGTGTGTLWSRKAPLVNGVNIGLVRRNDYTFPAPTSQLLSSLPAITAGTFNLPTYDATYDSAPTLTALAGNYTGSAGVGVAEVGATFDIAADGAITGTAGACTLGGNAVVHPTGGNVYDVTLTVSGGSCTSAGAFTGVSTYDATAHQIVVTTMNAARDKGLMFVGTKP